MLRLFSSIRKTLINEGKTSRYVRYAVGEVLLIMVGILLALQISNWNEAGKTSAKEIEILKSLKVELESDLIALDGVSLRHERIVDSANTVIQHIEKGSPYDESLSGHFFISSGNTYRMYRTAAYETLKSLGVDLISNQALRQQIIRLYETLYPYMDNFQDTMQHSKIFRMNEVYSGRFEESHSYSYPLQRPGVGTMTPVNFENLKKDATYLYNIKTARNRHKWYLERHCRTMKVSLEKLVSDIAKEIQRLEK